MTLKNTVNGVVKPKVYEEGYQHEMLISEDVARKSERAAVPKSRSYFENLQDNDLNIEISQKDIDKAAKRYHKEMRNRRRHRNGGDEVSQLQPGFLPVLTQVLFNEIQDQQPGIQQEVYEEAQPEIHTRSQRPHLKHPRHRRCQMAKHEHEQRRERPQERENQGAQEPSSRRLKHLKQRSEGLVACLEENGMLNRQQFRTQEELLQKTHIRLGNPIQLGLQDEQTQIANNELSRKPRRRQKHGIQQDTSLDNPGALLESGKNNSRQRRHKHTRQPQQSSGSAEDISSRQRHHSNHRHVHDLLGESPRASETGPVSRMRHNRQRRPRAEQAQIWEENPESPSRQRRPQAEQAQIWEENPESPSRQRRQRRLAQQHGPPESPTQSHATDSESRLRRIVQQQIPEARDEGHFHQRTHSGQMQTQLRSPILNDVANEEFQAGQRRQRVHNSPRILHPCDRLSSSEEESPQTTPSQDDRPPSDEYYAGNEAEIPPYHATLHKYLDLISYDPRIVPCLRVNRSLIKNNDKLSESIFQFLKFNLFPESIDPWEISHIDDQHYDDLIPDLIPVETDSSDVLPNMPYEPHYRHHNNMVPQIISDDDYEYALYLSTLENNVHNYATGIGSTVRGQFSISN